MQFFHERLRSARKMNGLSLEALKVKLEGVVSKQSLHKYETGQMKPDSKIISSLCKVLDVRPDYFYKDKSIVIENVSFRKLEKCSLKEQEKVIQKTSDFLERYLELENLLGVQYKKTKIKKVISVESLEEIDKHAQNLRKSWGLGTGALYNVIEVLEDKGVKVLEIDADHSFDGLSTWVNRKVPVIVVNRSKHKGCVDRLRFTVLHELGHLMMDIDDFPEQKQEKFCHYFAGAMLMPKDMMFFELGDSRSNISIRELGLIKKQYGLSIQSLLFRSKELGIISNRTFSSSFGLMTKMNWRIKEPEEFDFKGAEKSNRFDQLILRGVTEGVITSSKAASLMNMKLATFRKYITYTTNA